MGLDGGTYVTRSDVLRGQSWQVANQDNTRSTRGGCVSTSQTYEAAKLAKETARQVRWSTCALSEQPLQPPIVSDWLGTLYNKDAVVEYLLSKKDHVASTEALYKLANQMRVAGNAYEHLQSLKDIFEIVLTPSSTDVGSASTSNDAPAPWECPITHLPCTKYPFTAISSCGHVVSDRALQHLSGDDCPVCGAPHSKDDLVPVNGTEEQVQELRSKLKDRKATKQKGKGKDKKKRLLEGGHGQGPSKAMVLALTAGPTADDGLPEHQDGPATGRPSA